MRISDSNSRARTEGPEDHFCGGVSHIDAAAIVLAGGSGKRAGGPKAFLAIEGIYLITQVLERTLYTFREVIISCRQEDAKPLERIIGPFPVRSRVMIVPDRVEGLGPLEGISAGLEASRREWVFVIGCDMPLLQDSVIRFMWHRRQEGRNAVIARIGGYIEPLHAFYRKSVRKAVDDAIDSCRHKITSFIPGISPVILEEEEMSHIPGSRRSFTNINTPEDIRKWLEERSGLN